MIQASSPHGSSLLAATRFLLRLGITIPFIYYGIQLLAAPFFPDFSIIRHTASELGSNLSRHPSIFNIGIIIQGIITLPTAIGFLLALHRLRANPIVTLLTFLALATNGFQHIWAGIHPLPDPAHAGQRPFIIATTLLPFLLTLSTWPLLRSHPGRIYFILNCLLLLSFLLITSQISGLHKYEYRGLIQRIFTLTIFPPIAVWAHLLIRRLSP